MDKTEINQKEKLIELTENDINNIFGGTAQDQPPKEEDKEEWDPYVRRRPGKKGS